MYDISDGHYRKRQYVVEIERQSLPQIPYALRKVESCLFLKREKKKDE